MDGTNTCGVVFERLFFSRTTGKWFTKRTDLNKVYVTSGNG